MPGLADVHHVEFTVSNAMQAAYWYCCAFGFEKFAEKRTSELVSVAVRNGKAILVFTSRTEFSKFDKEQLIIHGDTVRDVAFRVDDIRILIDNLAKNNIEYFQPLTTLEDKFGAVRTVKLRSVETDLLHSLVQIDSYNGVFLPGFEESQNYPIGKTLPILPIELLDHVVQAYPIDTIETTAEWYIRNMMLHRFWSIDDKKAKAEYTAIKAWLLVNDDEKAVQVTLAESAKGYQGRSQIQECIDFNGGPGVQHMAFRVNDIVNAVVEMKKRSVEFLTVPSTYYDMLEDKLAASKLDFKGDLQKLREHCILMDFDDNGYLLQIFTKPCQDRPCLFIEIIQRKDFDGFGAGNFKSLFEAVEREQKLRGTLGLDENHN